jgi:hypothetical protein
MLVKLVAIRLLLVQGTPPKSQFKASADGSTEQDLH